MTTSTSPSALGEQLRHLIERAIEHRLVPGEEEQLWALVSALTEDRREPADEDELARALRWAMPPHAELSNRTLQRISKDLLQMTVVTKLPHPVWRKTDG